MYERKTIIKNLLKKYNKTYISVVENLDKEKAGCVSSCNFKVYFDVLGDSILIEDAITKENISIYYEFMSNEDLEKYSLILNDFFMDRYISIYKELFGDSSLTYSFFLVKKTTQIYNIDGSLILESFVLDVRDTLKPINEYIAEIKKSEQYTALMSKK